MLKILFANNIDEIRNLNNVIFNIEFGFKWKNLKDSDTVRNIIKYVDRGVYIDQNSFKDRFGYKLYTKCLSTGCKAALLVAEYPNKIVNCIECGSNALEAIILYCKDGEILVYGSTLDNVHLANNREVDVELNGIHFTSSSKLDRYIDLGELDG